MLLLLSCGISSSLLDVMLSSLLPGCPSGGIPGGVGIVHGCVGGVSLLCGKGSSGIGMLLCGGAGVVVIGVGFFGVYGSSSS